MGLSGRKQKQRIPNDPRNLAWADDASKFGQAYLSKFGWDSSKGLGAAGDGRLSHIKVSQKLDMLGIGAAQQRDPDGIAWKQNKDFEALLARLNGQPGEEVGVGGTNVEGFYREMKVEDAGGDVKMEEEPVVDEEEENPVKDKKQKDKKDKKRKREEEDGEPKKKKKRKSSDDEVDESDMKSKKDKKEKKDKKSKRKSELTSETPQDEEISPADTPQDTPPTTWIPRVKAHRARFLASKNIATKSASAIAEILGVSRTPSLPSSRTDSPMAALTPITDDPAENSVLNDGITTTSTKSVTDYLRARLSSKSKLSNAVSSTSDEDRSKIKKEEDDEDEGAPRMRMGLGMGNPMRSFMSTTVNDDETAQKVGLSAFSSLRTSAFLKASTMMLPSTFPDADTPLEPIDTKEEEQEVSLSKLEKKKRKSRKDKKTDSADTSDEKSKEEPKEEEQEASDLVDHRKSGSHWSEDDAPATSKEERKAAKALRKAEKERKKQLKAQKREEQS